ncbi:uncharacterized protein LOC126902858 [Daktulosphaira vitifoliae]|uniref:uncharacterized protein LOC126902858 n=1 Tax=Daktulosphaira vitifoliae TaxID=58002 RepID=UPI0021AA8175|nr:uncharacterized protein LOC126902858 [Daktulosphaira vitifoliae]
MSSTISTDSDDPIPVDEIVLPTWCLMKGIDTILQDKHDEKSYKSQKNYCHKVETEMEAQCFDHSALLVGSTNRLKLGNSLSPLMSEMRLCLLADDWDGYKQLLLMLFRSQNVSNKHIMFLIRSCFVLLLNHPNRSPGILDNFMSSCLNINDESRKIDYLEHCFRLKVNSGKDSDYTESKDNEEEEVFFDSEYSSDSS